MIDLSDLFPLNQDSSRDYVSVESLHLSGLACLNLWMEKKFNATGPVSSHRISAAMGVILEGWNRGFVSLTSHGLITHLMWSLICVEAVIGPSPMHLPLRSATGFISLVPWAITHLVWGFVSKKLGVIAWTFLPTRTPTPSG